MNGTANGHSAAATLEPELYSNSEFDPDDDDEIDCNSLEGTSVDDDDVVTNGERCDQILTVVTKLCPNQ